MGLTLWAFADLKAAPRRLGNPGLPVPFAEELERVVLPDAAAIEDTVREMLAG